MAAEQTLTWTIVPHLCRVCFGRVLARRDPETGAKQYICSNCETQAAGHGPECLCCCGMKWRGRVDAGIRCVPNTKRSPDNPGVILAEQIEAVAK